MYKLKTPITILNKTYNYILWCMVNYPISNDANWQLVESEENRLSNIRDICTIPENIIENWGTDDTVIPKWIESKIIN